MCKIRTLLFLDSHAPLAQLAEHGSYEPGVMGSSPIGSITILFKNDLKTNIYLLSER